MADPTPDQGTAPVAETPAPAPAPTTPAPSPEPVADPTGAMAFLDQEEAAALAEMAKAGLSIDGEEMPPAPAPETPATAPAAAPDQPPATEPAPASAPRMIPEPAMVRVIQQRDIERERADRLQRELDHARGLAEGISRAAPQPATAPQPPQKHPVTELDEKIAEVAGKYDAEREALAKRYDDGDIRNMAEYRRQEKAIEDRRAAELKPFQDRRTVVIADITSGRRLATATPKPTTQPDRQPVHYAAHSIAVQEATNRMRALEPWVDRVPADWWDRATLKEDVQHQAAELGWNVNTETEEGLVNLRAIHIAVAKNYGWDKRFGGATAAPAPAAGSATKPPTTTPAPGTPIPPMRFPPSLAAGIGRGHAVTDGNAVEAIARMSFHDATSLPDDVLDRIAPAA